MFFAIIAIRIVLVIWMDIYLFRISRRTYFHIVFWDDSLSDLLIGIYVYLLLYILIGLVLMKFWLFDLCLFRKILWGFLKWFLGWFLEVLFFFYGVNLAISHNFVGLLDILQSLEKIFLNIIFAMNVW